MDNIKLWRCNSCTCTWDENEVINGREECPGCKSAYIQAMVQTCHLWASRDSDSSSIVIHQVKPEKRNLHSQSGVICFGSDQLYLMFLRNEIFRALSGIDVQTGECRQFRITIEEET